MFVVSVAVDKFFKEAFGFGGKRQAASGSFEPNRRAFAVWADPQRDGTLWPALHGSRKQNAGSLSTVRALVLFGHRLKCQCQVGV
jgi:hypothetical protein